MTIDIRPFRPDDAPYLAVIVRRCLREVNSRDYPADFIDSMCAHFTAERFVEMSEYRRIYVAADEHPVGTVSRDGNKVYAFFVDPDLIGQGIGRRLLGHVEALAAREGYDYMETGASTTAHSFYLRLGYSDIHDDDAEPGLSHIVRKPLQPTTE